MTDRCEDVEPLWSAWVDGMLSESDRDRVADHLRRCRGCVGEVDGLRQLREHLRNLPVRRLPPDLAVPPDPRREPAPSATIVQWSGRQRVAAGFAVTAGFLGGAVFALGGQPVPDQQVVNVPVDLFVADHLVHTVGGPLSTPMVLDGHP